MNRVGINKHKNAIEFHMLIIISDHGVVRHDIHIAANET